MWRDHLNAIVLGQLTVQPVAVVGFVGDQSRGERVEETLSEDPFDKLAFVRRDLPSWSYHRDSEGEFCGVLREESRIACEEWNSIPLLTKGFALPARLCSS